MCGIFGFALKTPIAMDNVFRLLEKLEVHQYPSEPKPVGGYGAGIAVLEESGEVLCEKIGSSDGSPAKRLSEIFSVKEASILIAHVRMPSPQFMTSSSFKETAQPYIARCNPSQTIVSVHNGSVANYKEIRKKLGEHVFESEKVELIDSEVIPHLFEELLMEKADVDEALDALFLSLEGPSALSLLHVEKERVFMHFIHKEKTRGLHVWTNWRNEVFFCSRNELLVEMFGDMLTQGKFERKVAVSYREDASLKLSFTI
jgi:glucosamine 6-phosphate synthetase-like amidotransferase/phosphosugar isomerase protein